MRQRPVHVAEPPLEHDAGTTRARRRTRPGHDARRDPDAGQGGELHDRGQRRRAALPGGPPRPIALTLHNPNDVAVYVTELTVSATANTPRGCRHDDLVLQAGRLRDRGYTEPNAIVVPAHGNVTLPTQGVAAPTIRLVDNGTDQTAACENEDLQPHLQRERTLMNRLFRIASRSKLRLTLLVALVVALVSAFGAYGHYASAGDGTGSAITGTLNAADERPVPVSEHGDWCTWRGQPRMGPDAVAPTGTTRARRRPAWGPRATRARARSSPRPTATTPSRPTATTRAA